MKDQVKEKIVLLTLNDNTKLEGVLVKIDRENFKIILEKGKQTNNNGTVENFDNKEVNKKDIKEIRLIEEKDKPKEPEKVEIKEESKKVVVESSSSNLMFNAIPLSIQEKYQNNSTKYESNDFFDGLVISNNKDNYKDIKTFNEKNKETFGLDDTYDNNGNKKGQKRFRRTGTGNKNSRGGGGQSGRGNYGGNRGGYGYNQGHYNNNYNSYNNQGGYNNYNNYSSQGNNNYSLNQYGVKNTNYEGSNYYQNYQSYNKNNDTEN